MCWFCGCSLMYFFFQRIRPGSSFLSLGGDSLATLRVVKRSILIYAFLFSFSNRSPQKKKK